MIRFLLSLLFCPHTHCYLERDKTGRLGLVCERCAKRFPLALSNRAKAKRLKHRMAQSRRQGQPSADVLPMRRAK